MVRCLKFTPVVKYRLVAYRLYLLFEPIELVNRIRLHRVTQPGRQVSFDIGPAYDMGYVNDANRGIRFDDFTWRLEIVIWMLEDLARQMPHKIEYARLFPLVLA